ncbi:MAG: type VI secretion system tube protein Hcp [Pseudomonadota bacterium]
MKKFSPSSIAALVGSAMLITMGPAHAGLDMFLTIPGIPGSTTDATMRGSIDILAYSMNITAPGSGRTAAVCGEIVFQKYIDIASPVLIGDVLTGSVIPSGRFTTRRTGESPVPYVTLDMTGITVTNLSTGGSGGEDRLVESVTMKVRQYKFSYQEVSPSGQVTVKEYGYDCDSNRRL